jgi:hypothetical protein
MVNARRAALADGVEFRFARTALALVRLGHGFEAREETVSEGGSAG